MIFLVCSIFLNLFCSTVIVCVNKSCLVCRIIPMLGRSSATCIWQSRNGGLARRSLNVSCSVQPLKTTPTRWLPLATSGCRRFTSQWGIKRRWTEFCMFPPSYCFTALMVIIFHCFYQQPFPPLFILSAFLTSLLTQSSILIVVVFLQPHCFTASALFGPPRLHVTCPYQSYYYSIPISCLSSFILLSTIFAAVILRTQLFL